MKHALVFLLVLTTAAAAAPTKYTPLVYRDAQWYGSTFWTGPDWTRVGKDWHHPGQNTPSVRRFTAPRDGRVTVTGRVFKPDLAILAYGMNDRSPERQQRHRANLESIIATVRATSPDTEFLIVTPMMNNPIPGGHEPILAIRDAALSIHQPGVAHADVTSAHQAILQRKPFLDTTGNGSNHPNDFLHRVYAMRILEVLAQ
jgi:hypothetical protein